MTGTVLQVGGGRGFVVGDFVITAAHCLPHLPLCLTFSDTEDRTYQKLLGRLGEEPTVWAEVVFVDPVSDLAILCEPDSQELSDQKDAYCELLETADSFAIADIEADKEVPAKVLSLGGEWMAVACRYSGPFRYNHPLLLKEPITKGGMSGSPILDNSGNAIGVVCSGFGDDAPATEAGNWSINCRLMRSLPRWFPLAGEMNMSDEPDDEEFNSALRDWSDSQDAKERKMTTDDDKEKVIPIATRGNEAHVKSLVREIVHNELNEMDGPPPEAEVNALAGHAFELIQRLDGNVEFARRTWTAAFDEAERLDYNNQLEE